MVMVVSWICDNPLNISTLTSSAGGPGYGGGYNGYPNGPPGGYYGREFDLQSYTL
jgi:hypothetical protein